MQTALVLMINGDEQPESEDGSCRCDPSSISRAPKQRLDCPWPEPQVRPTMLPGAAERKSFNSRTQGDDHGRSCTDLIVPASEQGSEMPSDPTAHSAGSINVCRVGFFPATFALDFFHAVCTGKPIGDGATMRWTTNGGGQELGYVGASLQRGINEKGKVDVEVFNLDMDVNEDVCVRNETN